MECGIFKAGVLRAVIAACPSLSLLIRIIKVWARNSNLNNPKQGTLNSYSLGLLCIFHLQTLNRPRLPPFWKVFPGGGGAEPPESCMRPMHNGAAPSEHTAVEIQERLASWAESYVPASEEASRDQVVLSLYVRLAAYLLHKHAGKIRDSALSVWAADYVTSKVRKGSRRGRPSVKAPQAPPTGSEGAVTTLMLLQCMLKSLYGVWSQGREGSIINLPCSLWHICALAESTMLLPQEAAALWDTCRALGPELDHGKELQWRLQQEKLEEINMLDSEAVIECKKWVSHAVHVVSQSADSQEPSSGELRVDLALAAAISALDFKVSVENDHNVGKPSGGQMVQRDHGAVPAVAWESHDTAKPQVQHSLQRHLDCGQDDLILNMEGLDLDDCGCAHVDMDPPDCAELTVGKPQGSESAAHSLHTAAYGLLDCLHADKDHPKTCEVDDTPTTPRVEELGDEDNSLDREASPSRAMHSRGIFVVEDPFDETDNAARSLSDPQLLLANVLLVALCGPAALKQQCTSKPQAVVSKEEAAELDKRLIMLERFAGRLPLRGDTEAQVQKAAQNWCFKVPPVSAHDAKFSAKMRELHITALRATVAKVAVGGDLKGAQELALEKLNALTRDSRPAPANEGAKRGSVLQVDGAMASPSQADTASSWRGMSDQERILQDFAPAHGSILQKSYGGGRRNRAPGWDGHQTSKSTWDSRQRSWRDRTESSGYVSGDASVGRAGRGQHGRGEPIWPSPARHIVGRGHEAHRMRAGRHDGGGSAGPGCSLHTACKSVQHSHLQVGGISSTSVGEDWRNGPRGDHSKHRADRSDDMQILGLSPSVQAIERSGGGEQGGGSCCSPRANELRANHAIQDIVAQDLLCVGQDATPKAREKRTTDRRKGVGGHGQASGGEGSSSWGIGRRSMATGSDSTVGGVSSCRSHGETHRGKALIVQDGSKAGKEPCDGAPGGSAQPAPLNSVSGNRKGRQRRRKSASQSVADPRSYTGGGRDSSVHIGLPPESTAGRTFGIEEPCRAHALPRRKQHQPHLKAAAPVAEGSNDTEDQLLCPALFDADSVALLPTSLMQPFLLARPFGAFEYSSECYTKDFEGCVGQPIAEATESGVMTSISPSSGPLSQLGAHSSHPSSPKLLDECIPTRQVSPTTTIRHCSAAITSPLSLGREDFRILRHGSDSSGLVSPPRLQNQPSHTKPTLHVKQSLIAGMAEHSPKGTPVSGASPASGEVLDSPAGRTVSMANAALDAALAVLSTAGTIGLAASVTCAGLASNAAPESDQGKGLPTTTIVGAGGDPKPDMSLPVRSGHGKQRLMAKGIDLAEEDMDTRSVVCAQSTGEDTDVAHTPRGGSVGHVLEVALCDPHIVWHLPGATSMPDAWCPSGGRLQTQASLEETTWTPKLQSARSAPLTAGSTSSEPVSQRALAVKALLEGQLQVLPFPSLSLLGYLKLCLCFWHACDAYSLVHDCHFYFNSSSGALQRAQTIWHTGRLRRVHAS
jgi:hypothetical protein